MLKAYFVAAWRLIDAAACDLRRIMGLPRPDESWHEPTLFIKETEHEQR
jgi:hypothetical protein